MTFREALAHAAASHAALPHFNFSDLATLRGILRATRERSVPVVLGLSEGEREAVGVSSAVSLVRGLREEGYQIFLNADHTHSLEKAEEALRAGFDEVLFDGATLSFEENIRLTSAVVVLGKTLRPEALIEGELGYIGSASEIREQDPDGGMLTTPQMARDFVEHTGVHLFAPSVGNIHGMRASGFDPDLDIARIREIRDAVSVPLVLHGASGNSPEDIRASIDAGISMVHVSTELRRAWREGMETTLKEDAHEVAPYKLTKRSEDMIYRLVSEKLSIMGW